MMKAGERYSDFHYEKQLLFSLNVMVNLSKNKNKNKNILI